MHSRRLLALSVLALGALIAVVVASGGGSDPNVSIGQSGSTTTTGAPVTTTSAPATTSTTVPGPPRLQDVTYRGVTIQVPTPWPVYDLANDAKRCARVDQHAVYLGAQGADPDCPSRIIGRTETVQIQELGGNTTLSEALATSPATVNGLNLRVDPGATAAGVVTALLPDRGLLVTITFATNPALAQQILESLHAG